MDTPTRWRDDEVEVLEMVARRSSPARSTAIVTCLLAMRLLAGAPLVAQEPPGDGEIAVTVTDQELGWSVGDHGSTGWNDFGATVAADEDLCSEVAVGGPIATLRLDLVFDLSEGTLAGDISGTMRRFEEGEDWATGSFTGAIADGWVEDTPNGFAWGGASDMALTFAGVRTCAEIVDAHGQVIERITAEAEEPQTLGVPVEFSGGAVFDTDGSDGLSGSEFEDRHSIEDALDTALRTAGAGCVIGGGHGLVHSYVDLALTDLDAGIAATRERLHAGGLPERTWIQFFDTPWRHKWVGLYPTTPEPPLG